MGERRLNESSRVGEHSIGFFLDWKKTQTESKQNKNLLIVFFTKNNKSDKGITEAAIKTKDGISTGISNFNEIGT